MTMTRKSKKTNLLKKEIDLLKNEEVVKKIIIIIVPRHVNQSFLRKLKKIKDLRP